ncbi:MAG: DUF2279 domain-containing protein [Deltaproteobacteria bacterium]|nr:DUF2279 domain-containing protein [Deltaproteobacteria bacterium]
MRSRTCRYAALLVAMICVPAVCSAGDVTAAAEEPDPRSLRRRNTAVIGGIVLGVGGYGAMNWWNEGMTSSAWPRSEGWFGQGTYAGGSDKLGHAYITYGGTRLLARAFEGLGNEAADSLKLAGLTTFGVMTGVELVDSFSSKWRFSIEDTVFNAAGVALALAMEKYPSLDALVDFRLLYRRSGDARRLGTNDPLGDYSGQTYLLAFKLDGVPRLRDLPLARYLELQAGYGTRGYELNDGVKSDPHRRVSYGVAVNVSRLLGDTLFRGGLRGGRIQGAADTFLEFLQVPGTTALRHHRLP